MNITAVDLYIGKTTLNIELGNNLSVSTEITPIKSVMDGIKNADYISLHVPKQDDGSAVIGQTEFSAMKDNVRLINAARGGVIDEDALLVALENGKVASCALDVFENEPNPRKELLSHSKIACTPHVGAATGEAQDRIGTELSETIIAKFGVH